jgi:hypothetical protein
MDLGGLQVLDVAIGLVALFFLLSTALSSINEAIANILGWRAKTLEDALGNLVGDPKVKQDVTTWARSSLGLVEKPVATDQDTVEPIVPTLWDHWRMKALVRNPDSKLRRRARPSYLPPRAFSLALAETIAAGAPDEADVDTEKSPWQQSDEKILKRVKAAADGLPEGGLKELVEKAAVNANQTLEGFRTQVEHLFDDSMERASGWYKRKVQLTLAILATIVVVGLNVDTVHVTTKLWNDPAVRESLAAQASQIEQPGGANAAREEIEELGLPVGWGDNAPDSVWAALPGWIIAIAALNLGAPFWFDLLSRLARLRGSGLQERPRALSDTTATERPERKPIVATITAEPAAEPDAEPAAEPEAETSTEVETGAPADEGAEMSTEDSAAEPSEEAVAESPDEPTDEAVEPPRDEPA